MNKNKGACHPGGRYRNYCPGALPWSQRIEIQG